MGQQKILTQVGDALAHHQPPVVRSAGNRRNGVVAQAAAERLAAEISAAGQLVMLTQRIGKSANEFQTMEGVSPEAVFLLGKDLNSFKEIAQGLLDGSPELRLAATKDAQTREQLEACSSSTSRPARRPAPFWATCRAWCPPAKRRPPSLPTANRCAVSLEDLQSKLSAQTGLGAGTVVLLAPAGLFVLLCACGIGCVSAAGQPRPPDSCRIAAKGRQAPGAGSQARQRRQPGRHFAPDERTADGRGRRLDPGSHGDGRHHRRHRRLGELHGGRTAPAGGQRAEHGDPGGADDAQVDSMSTELLAASTEQLREIRETGQSVLDMASRINEVSAQAQESATVARQSLQAAESGLQAVQNAIGGMNSIRDQIQETSKRIKRLGESSQEIGEITELISDITEQTNVLALNAAIQAASAGEAGRGFSVVAEEVQRLAERSADATRQISALVKAIQTDTQDAVAAMERSTQGVVEGAKLSDSAGTALSEIDRVSRRLAELIEQISSLDLPRSRVGQRSGRQHPAHFCGDGADR